MKIVKPLLSSLFFSLICLFTHAQGPVEMADTMRSSGKIYVVIAVMLTILLGLLLYVVRIDRKISKLEKK